MIIKETGDYILTEDLVIRSTIKIGVIKKGTKIKITQIDKFYNKVIGPLLLDWIYWDIPAIKG